MELELCFFASLLFGFYCICWLISGVLAFDCCWVDTDSFLKYVIFVKIIDWGVI